MTEPAFLGILYFIGAWAAKKLLDHLWPSIWRHTKSMGKSAFHNLAENLNSIKEHEQRLAEDAKTDTSLQAALVSAAAFQFLRAIVISYIGLHVALASTKIPENNERTKVATLALNCAGIALMLYGGITLATAQVYFKAGAAPRIIRNIFHRYRQ